jgi:hypothetical protein
MAMGWTHRLTGIFLGGKGQPARKADNLTAICEPNIYKMWDSRRLTTLWAFTVCHRDSFTIIIITLRLLTRHINNEELNWIEVLMRAELEDIIKINFRDSGGGIWFWWC